jgi:DNA-binding NarL/FixJ family response regulator
MAQTILIVEDHDVLRDTLQQWLGAVFPHCHFLEAKSGEEALCVSRERAPDLVLMDVGLPQMNGIEATRHIKAHAPQTRVIMLTIQEDAVYRADAKAAGADGYVPKRTMQRELLPLLAQFIT